MNTSRQRPFWRAPEAWLIVGLPLAAVAALAATLYVAGGRSYDATPDAVQRVGRAPVADLAPDREAARRGLRGTLILDATGAVVVTLLPDPGDTELVLTLAHPIDAARDRSVVLERAISGWRGRTVADDASAWHVRLAPRSAPWRLAGYVARGAHAAELAPAVAQP